MLSISALALLLLSPTNNSFLFSSIALPEVDNQGILVLVNLANTTETVSTSVFQNVPATGTVVTKSVGFSNPNIVVG